MTEQHQLLTVSAAVDLAAEHGVSLTRQHISRACRLGDIANAQLLGNSYAFTDHDFLHWLRNRPKPGPKPQETETMMTEQKLQKISGIIGVHPDPNETVHYNGGTKKHKWMLFNSSRGTLAIVTEVPGGVLVKYWPDPDEEPLFRFISMDEITN